MITLRLFETSNPFQQIEEHTLPEGDTVVGRDASCDWSIGDKHGDMSRRHCVFTVRGGEVHLTDTSANGMLLGAEKRPVRGGGPVRLTPGETIHLGQYMILVDGAAPAKPWLGGEAQRTPRPLADHAGPATDAALLERFCIAAGLEPSSFAGEDPAGVMTRLGAAWRQVVDDLCDWMGERTATKEELNLDRTTISARDNNPLKWVDSERVAVELLQDESNGFLRGAAAFQASFADLRRHGDSLAASAQAALDEVVSALDPDRLESELKRQPLAFVSRHDALWKHFRERHESLKREIAARASGRIEEAMRRGYRMKLAESDRKGDAA